MGYRPEGMLAWWRTGGRRGGGEERWGGEMGGEVGGGEVGKVGDGGHNHLVLRLVCRAAALERNGRVRAHVLRQLHLGADGLVDVVAAVQQVAALVERAVRRRRRRRRVEPAAVVELHQLVAEARRDDVERCLLQWRRGGGGPTVRRGGRGAHHPTGRGEAVSRALFSFCADGPISGRSVFSRSTEQHSRCSPAAARCSAVPPPWERAITSAGAITPSSSSRRTWWGLGQG